MGRKHVLCQTGDSTQKGGLSPRKPPPEREVGSWGREERGGFLSLGTALTPALGLC